MFQSESLVEGPGGVKSVKDATRMTDEEGHVKAVWNAASNQWVELDIESHHIKNLGKHSDIIPPHVKKSKAPTPSVFNRMVNYFRRINWRRTGAAVVAVAAAAAAAAGRN